MIPAEVVQLQRLGADAINDNDNNNSNSNNNTNNT